MKEQSRERNPFLLNGFSIFLPLLMRLNIVSADRKKKTLKRAHIPFCWAGNPLVTGTDQELKAIWVSPGKQVKNHHYKAKGFAGISAWVGKIPWRRKWQITPVFLPGKSHGFWRAIAHGLQKSDTTEWLNHHHKAKRWRGTNLFAMWRMKIKVNIN